MFLIGKHELENYFFEFDRERLNLQVVMKNRMKARVIKKLHYSWYEKILLNCTTESNKGSRNFERIVTYYSYSESLIALAFMRLLVITTLRIATKYALRDNVVRLRMQQNIELLVSSLNSLKTKGKSETGYNYTLSESRMSNCKLEHQEIRKAILSTQLRQFALFLLLFWSVEQAFDFK